MVTFNYFSYTRCPRAYYGCPCSRTTIWGIFFVEEIDAGGYVGIERYVVWGSPKKPQIRGLYIPRNMSIAKMIKEKKEHTNRTDVPITKVGEMYPNVVSEIGQYLLMKKLKNV